MTSGKNVMTLTTICADCSFHRAKNPTTHVFSTLGFRVIIIFNMNANSFSNVF
jgi:hypothetical protein